MTLREVIDHVDRVKPNAYTDEEKVLWLNELEYAIQADIEGRTDDFRKHAVMTEWSGSVVLRITDDGYPVLPVVLDISPGGLFWLSVDGVEYADGAPITGVVIENGTTTIIFNGGLVGTFVGAVVFRYDGCAEEMFAPVQYHKIYYTYLQARIESANGEWVEYDNTMQLFNGFLGEYQRWYARNYIDNEELRS